VLSWLVLAHDGSIAFSELLMSEELPLATLQAAAFRFLAGRSDAVLFGAQAVNAYVSVARMSEDVDVLSTRAEALAEEIRATLAERFHVAIRTREVGSGGFRVYQLRTPKNRDLVDVRQTTALPPCRAFDGVKVVEPAVLLAQKLVSMVGRAGRPKAATDLADAQRLLLACPELRPIDGPVARVLDELGAAPAVHARWRELAVSPLLDDEDS
jgi:hypothetical protein